MIRKAKGKRITAILLAALLAIQAGIGLAEKPAATEGIDIPEIGGMKTFDIPDNEAMRTVRQMKAGWNLGNTFDAYDGYMKYTEGTQTETIWVHAAVTKELLESVRDAGFNAVRIPVSWHNHINCDGQIDSAWMARVKEVADWALDLGLYVIVNVHHDNDLNWFYPDSAHYERSAAWLASVWKEMAETFKDCDDHLILESMNEPRLVGTPYEWSWDGETAECLDAADCINRLNQLFVDTVRSTGGNNATRYLAVPAYAGAPWNACSEAFRMPEDMVEHRLILTAHAYSPYDFALNTNSPDISFDLQENPEKKKEIFGIMDGLYDRFVSKGIPVLMDEFGATEKPGNYQARVNFAAYYTAAASAHGITCFWWDNGASEGYGEKFALIDRHSAAWIRPDIVLAMMKNCQNNR